MPRTIRAYTNIIIWRSLQINEFCSTQTRPASHGKDRFASSGTLTNTSIREPDRGVVWDRSLVHRPWPSIISRESMSRHQHVVRNVVHQKVKVPALINPHTCNHHHGHHSRNDHSGSHDTAYRQRENIARDNARATHSDPQRRPLEGLAPWSAVCTDPSSWERMQLPYIHRRIQAGEPHTHDTLARLSHLAKPTAMGSTCPRPCQKQHASADKSGATTNEYMCCAAQGRRGITRCLRSPGRGRHRSAPMALPALGWCTG